MSNKADVSFNQKKVGWTIYLNFYSIHVVSVLVWGGKDRETLAYYIPPPAGVQREMCMLSILVRRRPGRRKSSSLLVDGTVMRIDMPCVLDNKGRGQ